MSLTVGTQVRLLYLVEQVVLMLFVPEAGRL